MSKQENNSSADEQNQENTTEVKENTPELENGQNDNNNTSANDVCENKLKKEPLLNYSQMEKL